MKHLPDRKAGSLICLLLYIGGLALFYYKYVPLVGLFQFVLVPILMAAVLLTWRDLRQGTLYFIFAFPLINNLPYFFGISEPFPHAPAALVLFLFFFLGFLLNQEKIKNVDVFCPSLSKPLIAFALVVIFSAGITFLRFSNYFPLHGFAIYEIKTNTFGTSAGGAIMSVVFQALNYLTGMAFFLILSKTLRFKGFLAQALSALSISTIFSLGFALFQHFGHLTWGNNPISIELQLINGTFKDALSFGAYLSMATPFFLGMLFAVSSIRWKIRAAGIVLFSYYLIIYSGSKIALFSLLAASAVFGGWAGIVVLRERRKAMGKRKNRLTISFGIVAMVGILSGVVLFKEPIVARLASLKIVERFKNPEDMFKSRIRPLWKPALRMMADYPLTGVGIGGFIIEVPNYSDAYKPSEAVPESAENYLLQIGSELGFAGLLAILWVVWAIYREIRKGFREKSNQDDFDNKYLSMGATAGILAFVMNSQMHSYIGSYEIKYMLWLLIGILIFQSRVPYEGSRSVSTVTFSASEMNRSSREKPSGRRFAAVMLMAIMVFSGIHLWNSTHSLSLKTRTKTLGIIQDFGMDKVENTADGREFRWTREYGGIPLKISKPVLVVPIQSAHPDIVKNPLKIQFVLVKELFKHQRLIKETTIIDNNWKNFELSVSADLGQDAILLIKVSRTWNPKKVFGVNDSRNLGVAVGKIEYRD
jgi:hypothetical protein